VKGGGVRRPPRSADVTAVAHGYPGPERDIDPAAAVARPP
jgi:hypothetical protein